MRIALLLVVVMMFMTLITIQGSYAVPQVPLITYYDNTPNYHPNYDESDRYHDDHNNHHYDDIHHGQHTATAECSLRLHAPSVGIVHADDPYYHFYHPYNNEEQQVIRNTPTNKALISTQGHPYYNQLRNQQRYRPRTQYGNSAGTNAYHRIPHSYSPSNRYAGRYPNNRNNNNYDDYYDRSSG